MTMDGNAAESFLDKQAEEKAKRSFSPRATLAHIEAQTILTLDLLLGLHGDDILYCGLGKSGLFGMVRIGPDTVSILKALAADVPKYLRGKVSKTRINVQNYFPSKMAIAE